VFIYTYKVRLYVHMHDPITILEILQNDLSHNMVIFLAFWTELNIRSSQEHLTDDQKGPKGELQRNSGKVWEK
jgi:hypothetical protein